jgi:hypothetical protein
MVPGRALLAVGSILLMGLARAGSPDAPPNGDLHQGVTTCVVARKHWNHTGIPIVAGKSYLITAAGTWWDAKYRHGPGGGDSGSGLLGLMEGLRRMPHEDWFKLICGVDAKKNTDQAIGCGREVTFQVSGELTCFANDVLGFYWNNTGAVQMTVKWLD